jgi:hypothetical protein
MKLVAMLAMTLAASAVAGVSVAGGRSAEQEFAGKRVAELTGLTPGMSLPMRWKTPKKYEMRYLSRAGGRQNIIAIVEVADEQRRDHDMIVSAVDFSAIKKSQETQFDCYFANEPSCEGLLCGGLLVGVVPAYEARRVKFPKEGLRPTEVWKVTSKTLRFEKISPKGVVCKPQSYAS